MNVLQPCPQSALTSGGHRHEAWPIRETHALQRVGAKGVGSPRREGLSKGAPGIEG